MRLFNLEIFKGGVSGISLVYSSLDSAALLGAAEKYFVQAIVTQVSGTSPAFSLKLQTSNDGSNWIDKVILVNQSLVNPNTINLFSVSDSGSSPGGAYVRVAMSMGGADNNANVRVFVTGHSEQSRL